MNIEHSLPVILDRFGFVQREKKKNGAEAKNLCGRDFLYYVLHYYFPGEFNPETNNPVEIDKRKLFGKPLPSWLVWTCLPFYKVPKLFAAKGLVLTINEVLIDSFLGFLRAMISPKFLTADEALRIVEESVNKKAACGIDISVSFGGLVNHVMFVSGYDSENLYVFDTHNVKKIKYEKITPPKNNRFVMRLSKKTVRDMWSRFGRVWIVERHKETVDISGNKF